MSKKGRKMGKKTIAPRDGWGLGDIEKHINRLIADSIDGFLSDAVYLDLTAYDDDCCLSDQLFVECDVGCDYTTIAKRPLIDLIVDKANTYGAVLYSKEQLDEARGDVARLRQLIKEISKTADEIDARITKAEASILL